MISVEFVSNRDIVLTFLFTMSKGKMRICSLQTLANVQTLVYQWLWIKHPDIIPNMDEVGLLHKDGLT